MQGGEILKVLITGGAGFIGYHLAIELLRQGYQVTMVDNFSRGVRCSVKSGNERNPRDVLPISSEGLTSDCR